MKKAHGGQVPGSRIAQNEPSTTAARLATEHCVSPATVKRAAKFAEEVEKTPELKKAIETGRPVLQVRREIKEAKREERRRENRQKVEKVKSPEKVLEIGGKFSTVVIDPPGVGRALGA